MPATRPRRVLLLAAAIASFGIAHGAWAQAERGPDVQNSSLDGALFYQLIVGELELRDGDVGTAYQVLLDAAKRTKSEQIFRRATDVALQARAGEQALTAVQAASRANPPEP